MDLPPRFGLTALARCGAVAALVLAAAGCASIQNMAPDPASFHLPDRTTFLPANISSYSYPVSPTGPVAASELVDAQGLCPGVAPAAVPADPSALVQRGVSLDMSECEVVRRLGAPQAAEVTQPRGARSVVLTYTVGEHAGIYRFADGRLTSIERGEEPPPPPDARKPPARRPKPAA